MEATRFRAGVVGTGWWVDIEHLPGLQGRADVDVAAICGRNSERLASIADKFGVPNRFADWREMIARGEIRDANTLCAFARMVALGIV